MNNCDLCGDPEGIPLPQEPRIFVCKSCGFLHVKERRSTREVAADWTRIYRDKVYDPAWPGVQARLWYVTEWFEQNFGWEGRSVLDIGAGTGLFLSMIRERGAHPVGLEPDPLNVQHIKALDIACWLGTVEDAGPIGTYDVISILWTLENTADCMAMLRFAREHLNPKGHLIVATGSRILVPFKKRLSDYLPGPDREVDTHCYRWTRKSLERAMSLADFEYSYENDWPQNDVLMLVGQLRQAQEHLYMGGDAVTDILEFFDAWHRNFP
jgi:2-polyprenyl-3-methyl-5-hydroxy-6-metoxy-1,4-benzoquinol methylase